MLGVTLERILRADPYTSRVFKGLRAIDSSLSDITTFPAAFIVNTDKVLGPGIHWVCVYYVSDGEVEFFDSFGYHPSFYGFDFRGLELYCGQRPLQNPISYMCGPYCIMYLMHRARGHPIGRFISLFSDDCVVNDNIVYKFMKRNHLLP